MPASSASAMRMGMTIAAGSRLRLRGWGREDVRLPLRTACRGAGLSPRPDCAALEWRADGRPAAPEYPVVELGAAGLRWGLRSIMGLSLLLA